MLISLLSHFGSLSHVLDVDHVETIPSLGSNLDLVIKLLRHGNLQDSDSKSI